MNGNYSLSIGPIRDFNRKCQNFSGFSSKDESSLMITINMLKAELANLDEFDRNSIESRAFFVNLYQLMEKIVPTSMLFAHCLWILEQCAGKEELRRDLVDRYKFPTILAMYLNKNNDRKTIIRILTILNELTYGIQITWPEPYLTGLVHRLFEIIGYREEEEKSRENCAQMALSVLVNLAYKNPPVIEIFFTCINTEFLKSIQTYGVLTNKVYYILGQNSPKDLMASVKLYFQEIEKSWRSHNLTALRWTVEFAVDVFRCESDFISSNKSVINENLEGLLESIGSIIDENINGHENSIPCIAKILEFLVVLIELDYVEEAQYHRIVYFTSKLLKSHGSSVGILAVALQVLQVGAPGLNDKTTLLSCLESQVPIILEGFGERDIKCRLAILKFLRAFVRDKAFETLFFDHLNEDFFRNIFRGVECLPADSCQQQVSKWADDEVLYHVTALITLSTFSTVAPVKWFNLMIEFFKMKPVQQVIVEGLLRHTEELTADVLELARVCEFPNADISRMFASRFMPRPRAEMPPAGAVIEKHNPAVVSRLQCEKIDELLDDLEAEMTNNRHGISVDVANIIHLSQHQRIVARNTEKNYEVRLQQAGEQISSLTHRLQLIESELATVQNSYYSLELFRSNLTAENVKKQKLAEDLKRDILNYKHKNDTMKEHYDKLLSALQEKARAKEAEMRGMIKQLTDEFEECNHKFKSELKKAEKLSAENKEMDMELQKKTHIVESLTEENKASKNLIEHLKDQIEDKDTKVKELEEIQNTIINMMQGTKKKKGS